MAVKIGNASISENGSISGKAGDQTGREVYIKNWSRRSGGWVTLRCKNAAMREYIAEAMEKACANNDIGYDQYENKTLWNNIKDKGFDPSKTTKKVETDCARLVRVCVQYAAVKAGLNVEIPDFYTGNLVRKLLSTGLFEQMSASKYAKNSNLLERGMIQCTNGKGHTWVVLSNGSDVKSNSGSDSGSGSGSISVVAPLPTLNTKYALGDRDLRKGCSGSDVKELQGLLMKLGYNLPKYQDDGDFGSETLKAVKKFQSNNGLKVDGVVGELTLDAINKSIAKLESSTIQIQVTGNTVNVRDTNSILGKILFRAKRNEKYQWVSTSAQNGWYQIETAKGKAWISNRYSKIVK